MKILNRILFIFLLIEASLLYIQSTKAFFSDTAASSNNTFTASLEFASPTPTPSNTPTPTPTPTTGPGDIVINELMWPGSTKGVSDEWIELRNMTDRSIDISGWQLTKWATSGGGQELLMITVPGGNSIPAGSFFLVAQKSNSDAGSALNVAPNIVDT